MPYLTVEVTLTGHDTADIVATKKTFPGPVIVEERWSVWYEDNWTYDLATGDRMDGELSRPAVAKFRLARRQALFGS